MTFLVPPGIKGLIVLNGEMQSNHPYMLQSPTLVAGEKTDVKLDSSGFRKYKCLIPKQKGKKPIRTYHFEIKTHQDKQRHLIGC